MQHTSFKSTILAALFFVLTASFSSLSFSQDKDTALGTISYFEGSVKLSSISNPKDMSPVKLNQSVFEGQTIKTSFESAVEIKWINGSKTSIGSRSEQSIGSLYRNSKKNVKSKTESIWGNFLALFTSKSSESQEEGGIRRSQVIVDKSKENDDFAMDDELTFEACSKLYESKDYLKAANAFSTLLSQQPNHPKANFALFAKGHCFIELNNLEKAREVFQEFIVKYPNDSLAKSANDILQKL